MFLESLRKVGYLSFFFSKGCLFWCWEKCKLYLWMSQGFGELGSSAHKRIIHPCVTQSDRFGAIGIRLLKVWRLVVCLRLKTRRFWLWWSEVRSVGLRFRIGWNSVISWGGSRSYEGVKLQQGSDETTLSSLIDKAAQLKWVHEWPNYIQRKAYLPMIIDRSYHCI